MKTRIWLKIISFFLLSRKPDLFEVFDILFGESIAESMPRISDLARADDDARSRFDGP